MRPSLNNLPKRAADRARSAAEGSPVPAGQEPPAGPSAAAAAGPSAGERGSMRRRMRRLRRTREVLLRELGALVVEMQRLGRENPELVSRKASELIALDDELRGLRVALEERRTVVEVVAAGVAGSCARCGTLVATDDRFCSRCGLAVGAAAAPGDGAGPAEPAAAEAPPAAGAGGSPAAEPDGSPLAEPAAAAGEAGAEGSAAAEADGTATPAAPAAAAGAAAPPPPPPPPPPAARELSSSAPPQP
jgi:hypothetical protein